MEAPAIAPAAGQRLARYALAGAALVLAGCGPITTRPHTAAEWNACQNDADFQRVTSCTAVASDTRAEPNRRAIAYVLRGASRAQVGQYARAMADFGRAIRLDPRYANAYVERGQVFQQRGAFERAVRDFDSALAIDPNLPVAIQRRDDALSGRWDYLAEELRRLDDALARDPGNSGLLNNRCWTRAINDDDLDLALADCNAAIEHEPTNVEAWDSRGMVHLKREEFQAAYEDYNRAVSLRPGYGHYLYGRGIAQLRLGNADAGRADLANAEQVTPGITETYYEYGIEP
jgi:tetratricopeptide (TPR) repeat protein